MDVLFVLATVAVAQLVEPWIVIPVVVGSSPISHPNPLSNTFKYLPALSYIPHFLISESTLLIYPFYFLANSK
jgi:hypothetical protein